MEKKSSVRKYFSVYAMVESIRTGCGNVIDISTYDEKHMCVGTKDETVTRKRKIIPWNENG